MHINRATHRVVSVKIDDEAEVNKTRRKNGERVSEITHNWENCHYSCSSARTGREECRSYCSAPSIKLFAHMKLFHRDAPNVTFSATMTHRFRVSVFFGFILFENVYLPNIICTGKLDFKRKSPRPFPFFKRFASSLQFVRQ